MTEINEIIKAREVHTVKFGMDVAGSAIVPVGRAAHIADTAGADAVAVNAILVVLENLGFVATS